MTFRQILVFPQYVQSRKLPVVQMFRTLQKFYVLRFTTRTWLKFYLLFQIMKYAGRGDERGKRWAGSWMTFDYTPPRKLLNSKALVWKICWLRVSKTGSLNRLQSRYYDCIRRFIWHFPPTHLLKSSIEWVKGGKGKIKIDKIFFIQLLQWIGRL